MVVEKIRVLIVDPTMDPYSTYIINTLEEKQKIIGGLVQFIELENNVDLICNDEGKLNNLPMNRIIKDDVVCGTFIIAGQRNGETISLNERQIRKYKKYFKLRNHTIPICILRNKYKNSSNLLSCNLRGIEKILKLDNFFNENN